MSDRDINRFIIKALKHGLNTIDKRVVGSSDMIIEVYNINPDWFIIADWNGIHGISELSFKREHLNEIERMLQMMEM